MSRNVYYGLHGEYGPYTMREYGLPDAGEVFEEYRRVKLMSVQDFIESYNKEVAKYNEEQKAKQRKRRLPTITRNLVYKWEKHNMVPTDPERRRLIANILNIPLALFGIVAAEEIASRPVQQAPSTIITHRTVDIVPYEETARTLWKFHYTSTAQHEWYTITKAIKELEVYEHQFRGNLQRNVRRTLYSYCLLASRMQRENQRDYNTAYMYTNYAVRVAKSMQKDAQNENERAELGWLIARAQYARGYVKLSRGLYETKDEHGHFVVNRVSIQDAIADLEEAEKQASPGLKGNLYAELARAQGFGRQSNTAITLAQKNIEKAGHWIGVTSSEDIYEQNLYDGRWGAFNQGSHLLGTAITLNAVGRSSEAVKTLQELDHLKVGRIPSDYTRDNAWINIVWSQAAFGEKDFYTAALKAKSALFVCQDIQSATNIAIIENIYRQFLTTSYRNEQDVKDLRQLLKVSYKNDSREQ